MKQKDTHLSRKNDKCAVQTNPPRILIVGRNYVSNLCMARSLGISGYEIELIRVLEKPPTRRNRLGSIKSELSSKYIKKYHLCVTNGDSTCIINKIKDVIIPGIKTLLIPNDDLVASIIDLHLDELRQFFILPNINNKQGEINRLMQKRIQKEFAFAAGLPVAKSCVICIEKGSFEIPNTISYPCFLKPNVSKNSTKRIMQKCENQQELNIALKKLSNQGDIEVLVEDYLEVAKEYSLLGVSTGNEVFSPGLFVAEEAGHEDWKGVTMIGRVLPCEKFQSLIDQINHFIHGLKFEGLFDVDLIETTDGKIYFVELNLRFGASGYGITGCGVNIPVLFADYMLFGKNVDLTQKVQNGKRFINEKIMLDEFAKGYLSWKDVRKRMKEIEIHFIKNDIDKKPYRYFIAYYAIICLKRTLKLLRNNRR